MNDKVPGTRIRRRQKTDEEDILSAAAEILERRLQRQGRITDPIQAADVLKARVAHLDREVFGVVFLDTCTASWPSSTCSRAPSTLARSIPARWSAGPWDTMLPPSSCSTTIPRASRSPAPPIAL